MPVLAIEELKHKRETLERQPPRVAETSAARSIRENKVLFAAADRFLDKAVEGPMHLKDPRAARIVEDAILFGIVERYELFAWCVMSNHVHALLTPRWRGERNQSQAGKPDLQQSQAGKPWSTCRSGICQDSCRGSKAIPPTGSMSCSIRGGRRAGKTNRMTTGGRQAGKPDLLKSVRQESLTYLKA